METFFKCVDVIESCINIEQLAIASKFIALGFSQGHFSQLDYTELVKFIEKRQAEFD